MIMHEIHQDNKVMSEHPLLLTISHNLQTMTLNTQKKRDVLSCSDKIYKKKLYIHLYMDVRGFYCDSTSDSTSLSDVLLSHLRAIASWW